MMTSGRRRANRWGGARVAVLLWASLLISTQFLSTRALSQPAGAAPAPAAPAPAPEGAADEAEAGKPTPPAAPTVSAGKVLTPSSAGKVEGDAPRRYGRRKAEPLPAPTPEQLAALAELQKEAIAYETDAKDYRNAITRIVKHHYEERRRRVLDALDREIKIELKALKSARAEAIARLEVFVRTYSGTNSHPKNTPDAMYRLAALYEERARDAVDDLNLPPGEAPPAPDLGPAMALYKRIVREFPNYEELAGVYYYLGHAYNDVGRIEEAQQVWRSLVCHNHYNYPVPVDPNDPTKDTIQHLPQDHDPEWWLGWMQRHPVPMDVKRREEGARRGLSVLASDADTGGLDDDEDTFKDPYPSSCEEVVQRVEEGQQPRYLAEIWWQLGDYHFDEIDPGGGPYNLNRAESAYRHSMEYTKPPVYGVAMYKLAWTFFKQQRYETAVRQFVELLKYTDQQEKLTGNSGADFRAEAYAYIAGSVTYIDFEGPGENDPYIGRNDIFDLEQDSAVIEERMHVAIDRVQDPELIPQNIAGCLPKKTTDCDGCCDPAWTVHIYRALAFEYSEYNQYHNLIELNELILSKWPLHRDAPIVQNQIAEVYEQLSGQSRGEDHEKYAALALEARGKLIEYVETPENIPDWVDANKDDPEAIRTAERLVRGGIRRAAADHTNQARALVGRGRKAKQAGNEGEAQSYFERALAEYRAAGRAWGGYLLMDENAEDAYESRFWLADAYTNVVVLRVILGEMPSLEEVEIARRTAREVRDSNEDDRFMQNAALMVVRVAQQIVAANHQRFDQTGGAEGFERLESVKVEGEGDEKTYVKQAPPGPVKEMVTAFDEYIATVPPEADPFKNHEYFAYTSGELFFLYGQFDEAKKRLMPIYVTQCGKTKYGYLSWEKLITMANLDEDIEGGRALAEASKKKSCAVDEKQKLKEAGIRDPTISRGYYVDAANAYKKAQEMPEGPERDKQWRKAAALYEEALRKAPARDEAPEAAMLGASAYKQVGAYDDAIAMYQLFIKEYGNDENLAKLEKGDSAAGKAPQPKKYEERVKFLKIAYDELAKAYVLFFDYRTAASTYEKIGSIERFKKEERLDAAQNAVFLYANIGDSAKLSVAKQQYFNLGPNEEQRAEIDWLAATADLKKWDEFGPDRGDNRIARQRAMSAMESYYNKYSSSSAARMFSVQSAYFNAKMRRIGKDPKHKDWCRKTISQFDRIGSGGEDASDREKFLRAQAADMGAECEYRAIDAEIARDFDYAAGKHRYSGVVTDVVDTFKKDVETGAKDYFNRLQTVITKYKSPKWAVAARARQGSLYDSCRTGLYNARPPGLKLFTDEEEKKLAKADKLCEEQGSEKACEIGDTFRAKRRTDWRNTRDQLLADTDKAMVRGYAEAIEWAKVGEVQVDAADKAIGRLAFFTDIIGDDKLRNHTTGVKIPAKGGGPPTDFIYQDKMYLRMRRGLTADVKTDVRLAPLPVLAQ